MTPSAFVYTDKLQDYDYGGGHPLKMIRLKLTYELLKSCGAFGSDSAELVEAEPCTREEAESVHTPAYLDRLKAVDDGQEPHDAEAFGLGYGDNPMFTGVYAGSMLSTGASVQCAKMIMDGSRKAAFNIAGGLHHALPNRASGFCYINDPAVAIRVMADAGLRVAYVDIDAHHGDGVQYVFENTRQVLTVSLHESGQFLFPGSGYAGDMGKGDAVGYAVNVPLLPGTGDEVFTWAFFEVVPPLIDAFRPDVVVAQLGCDTFATDPLTHLRLSTHGFTKMVGAIAGFGIPWIGLGGGGYDVTNVARAWSLAYAIMAGIELPDELPEGYRALLKEKGLSGCPTMHDPSPTRETDSELRQERAYAEEIVRKLRKDLFPIHGI